MQRALVCKTHTLCVGVVQSRPHLVVCVLRCCECIGVATMVRDEPAATENISCRPVLQPQRTQNQSLSGKQLQAGVNGNLSAGACRRRQAAVGQEPGGV